MATRIHVLPIHVANKIAAGEVVDRPASVLKELVENALDAGAGRIDVEIVSGGRKLVAVSDDGSGMGRDDALLSIERQATSKIRDVDDIERIDTLGFRGEALAAIAAVSRFHLITAEAGGAPGADVRVAGGKLQDVGEIGCPAGTRIEVRDLFFNVPARRKFLRSAQTEMGHVRQAFNVLALAHPGVAFSFKVDGRTAVELAGDASLEDRIRDLFGPETLRHLRPVDTRARDVAVTGFVSLPSFTRADRNEQYAFINGRSAGAPLLHYAIREGYHALAPKDRHPSVFLCIHLDPGLVDVNVHPTKKEVRFRRPGDVRDTVIEAIRAALGAKEAAPPPGPATVEHMEPAPSGAPAADRLPIQDLPPARAFRYPRLPEEAWSAERGTRHAEPRGKEPAETAPPSGFSVPRSSPWSWCRVLGQIGSLYVVLETEDGMVLMDPHAAHERVLFERYMAQFMNGDVPTQNLLIPESVDLPPRDAARLRRHLDVMRGMGIGVSEFGGDTFVVDAVPAALAKTPARDLLEEVARDLEQAGARGAKGRWREESIAQAACKAAVKARDRLTLDEIERLVVDLARAEMPYTCPHGRPTLIFTSLRDLNRQFGRE